MKSYPTSTHDANWKLSVLRHSASRGWQPLVLTLLLSVAGFSLEAAEQANKVYDVGIARVDITPNYPIRLNGFGGRRTESEGITQPIWAKSLAISHPSDPHPLVLVTVDSLGIRLEMVDEVARRLAQKVGLPRDHLAVTFSHSHTTPKVNGASDTIFSTPIPAEHQEHIDTYTAQLTDWIEQVALQAIADRRPSQLAWNVGQVGFAVNRRTAGGPVDHDLPTLVVRDLDSNIRAIYVTYACHCVTLSHNKISGDWAGYAQEAIEREFPGVTALVSIGCGSDSNPNSGVTLEDTATAARQGGEIATEVRRLLESPLRPIHGDPRAVWRTIEIPLDPLPTREQLEQLASQESPAGYNARWQLQRLAAGKTLEEKINYPVQTWSFGDSLSMVFLAGEVCVDYSLRLKRELDPERIWVHGYANDFCAYIPSERLRQEGGYGGGAEVVYFALPATLRAGLEQPIIDEVHRQVPKSYSRIDDPAGTNGTRPKSPEDSLACMQTHADLRIELVAAEPLVVDPVAIDFGPDGRLWVVEMHDYPEGKTGQWDAGGRIRFLTDTDGDGQYDKSQIFLDNIPFPTGVSVWRKGVLVCAAPDIIYAEDTNGDGTADIVERPFVGFATHNYQARVNSLCHGLDNWIYASCGLFGGEITNRSGEKFNLTNRDFRFDPDTGLMESVSGTTQQSRVRDDWGNWFGCENGVLVRHYPLVDHYLKRNPHVAPPDPHANVAPSNELFPSGAIVSFALSGPPGRATAACGLGIYRDQLLGPEYYGNTFTCEPVNQLIHRLVLREEGTTFRGERAANEQNSEFIVSTDKWFRPVQVRTGPDGGLWFVDMYRYVIEHPRWIPPATLRTLNVRAGDAMGRIYRVVPRDFKRPPVVTIEPDSPGDLVGALDQTNGTQRDLIQQLLLWRNDPESIPRLRQLVSQGTTPGGRLHALCTLDGLTALDPSTLLIALRDKHPGVRRHAVRLSEPHLPQSSAILTQMLALANDPDTHVQGQLACSLGVSNSEQVPPVLLQLASRHANDDYFMALLLSSVNRHNLGPLLHGLATKGSRSASEQQLIQQLLAIAASMGDQQVIDNTLAAIGDSFEVQADRWQLEAIAVLTEASVKHDADQRVEQLAGNAVWRRLVEHARSIVPNADEEIDNRIVALRLLGYTDENRTQDLQLLADLLNPQTSPALQSAAIATLRERQDDAIPRLLLTRWSGHTPAIRSEILDALLARPEWSLTLLEGIKEGVVSPRDIDASRQQQLRQHATSAIAMLAAKVLSDIPRADRAAVIQDYRGAVATPGDPEAGRTIFRSKCANCHQLEDHGHVVGPDLAALTDRSPERMLVDMLDPNRTVDERYRNYLATTVDGEIVQGILAAETATSVTLSGQEGKKRVLLRQEIEELQVTPLSLMPEGMEKEISVLDAQNLISYLDTARAPAKQIPGNRAEIVAATAHGELFLHARQAAIYGDNITFEQPYQNVGFWYGERDHIAWRVDVTQSREWDIYLDWACADDSAGNRFVLEIPTESVRGVVSSTGGYDQYRQVKIGTVTLNPGIQRIILKPDGPLVRVNLMDCRGLYFVPVGTPLTLPDMPPAEKP